MPVSKSDAGWKRIQDRIRVKGIGSVRTNRMRFRPSFKALVFSHFTASERALHEEILSGMTPEQRLDYLTEQRAIAELRSIGMES